MAPRRPPRRQTFGLRPTANGRIPLPSSFLRRNAPKVFFCLPPPAAVVPPATACGSNYSSNHSGERRKTPAAAFTGTPLSVFSGDSLAFVDCLCNGSGRKEREERRRRPTSFPASDEVSTELSELKLVSFDEIHSDGGLLLRSPTILKTENPLFSSVCSQAATANNAAVI